MSAASDIVACLRDGLHPREIAARFGCAEGYVRVAAWRAGVRIDATGRSERHALVLRLHAEGRSVAEMAAAAGVTRRAVTLFLRRRGLTDTPDHPMAEVVAPGTPNPYDDDRWCDALGVVGDERRAKRAAVARIYGRAS